MSTVTTSGRLAAWASAAILLVALLPLGLVTGGVVATRVFATTDMGWDQLADALGGAMVGGVSALVIWAIAVRRLLPVYRLALAAVAVACTFGIWAASRIVPTNVQAGAPAAHVLVGSH